MFVLVGKQGRNQVQSQLVKRFQRWKVYGYALHKRHEILNAASARKWHCTAQIIWWCCAFAHLKGNTAADPSWASVIFYCRAQYTLLPCRLPFLNRDYCKQPAWYYLLKGDQRNRNWRSVQASAFITREGCASAVFSCSHKDLESSILPRFREHDMRLWCCWRKIHREVSH